MEDESIEESLPIEQEEEELYSDQEGGAKKRPKLLKKLKGTKKAGPDKPKTAAEATEARKQKSLEIQTAKAKRLGKTKKAAATQRKKAAQLKKA